MTDTQETVFGVFYGNDWVGNNFLCSFPTKAEARATIHRLVRNVYHSQEEAHQGCMYSVREMAKSDLPEDANPVERRVAQG